MGTLITPEKKDIFAEELDYKSGVAERTWFKIGAAINFINSRQNKAFDFKFIGDFEPITFPEDGSKTEIFDFEIVGVSGMLFDSGESGTTELDLRYYRNGVDQGSILTQNLVIANSVGTAQFFKELLTPNDSATSGVTLPNFSTNLFNAGDAIAPKLVSNAVSAENLIVNVHYRPR